MPTKANNSKTKKKQEKDLENQVKTLEIKTETMKKMEKEKKEREKIVKEKVDIIREDLKNQLLAQNKFGKQFDDMVEDYIFLVKLKEELQYDIKSNGIRYFTTTGNGFTSSKPNESVPNLLKVNGQMLKILQDLEENEVVLAILDEIGKKRGALISGGYVDQEKTAGIILDDFRNGKLGEITLEQVHKT